MNASDLGKRAGLESRIADATSPVTAVDIAVIAGSALIWLAVTGLAARSVGLSPWSTSSWDRWDSGHYLRIAESGYAFGHCENVANRGPSDWCGSSGWFPGYPYLMRLGGLVGPGHQVVGRTVSLVAMIVAWSALWFGFLKRRALAAGLLGMTIAAAFPAGVYYGAIFPVSIVVAAAVLSLVCLDRSRWLLAGCCGAVAAVAYPSGVVVSVIAVVPLTMHALGNARVRVRAAILVAAPIAGAYALVLANFQRATGHWDAWFKTQSSYHFEPAFPLQTLARQIGHVGDDVIPGIIGVQTTLVAAMVVAAAWVVVARRRELSIGERGTALLVAGLWVIPMTLGGDLSLYRAESLLLPIVILLVRLPAWVLAGLAAVSVVVGYEMAQLFFDNTLM